MFPCIPVQSRKLFTVMVFAIGLFLSPHTANLAAYKILRCVVPAQIIFQVGNLLVKCGMKLLQITLWIDDGPNSAHRSDAAGHYYADDNPCVAASAPTSHLSTHSKRHK